MRRPTPALALTGLLALAAVAGAHPGAPGHGHPHGDPLARAHAHALPGDLEDSIRERFEALAAEHAGTFEVLDPDDYRHPFESRVVGDLLANPDIQKLMPRALEVAEEFNQQYHRQHLLNGVLVSPSQFPDIYQMAVENAEALHMKKGFKVYVMNSAQMNAYTWSIDQDNYGIALYSGIIKALTPGELRYVLAHEMGHVKSKHILTTVLLQLYYEEHEDLPPELELAGSEEAAEEDEPRERPATAIAGGLVDLPASIARGITRAAAGGLRPMMVTDAQMSAFKLLQQAAEYSADRAGMVAAADRETGMMGLVKLASGHVGDLGGFDLEAYLRQVETVLDAMSDADLDAMLAGEGDHAFTLMRVAELGRFFDSESYQAAAKVAEASVFVRVVSASYQVGAKLLAAEQALEEFQEDAQAREEMNALKRRKLERKLAAAVEAVAPAEQALRALVLDACAEYGLATPGGPFQIFAEYARTPADADAFAGVRAGLKEKLTFALQDPDLDPAAKAELEAKLKTLEVLAGEAEEDEG